MADELSIDVQKYCYWVADEYDKANPGELSRRGLSLSAFKHSIVIWRMRNDKRLNEQDVHRPTLRVQIEKALQDGLLIDGEQATIMLFFNKGWQMLEAKYSQMYRGMIALAMRTGQVTSIVCECHYENDPVWRLRLGSDPLIEHEPFLGREKDRGALVGAYAVLRLTNGEKIMEWVGIDDLEKMQSQGQGRGGETDAWKLWGDEMRKAKALRRAFKRIYMDADLELSMQRFDEFARAPVATEGTSPPADEDEARALPHQQPTPEPQAPAAPAANAEHQAPAATQAQARPSAAKQALQKAASRNGNGNSNGSQEEPDHVKHGPPL